MTKPTNNLRITSANLNGIRSAYRKGFFDWLQQHEPDILCVQELKAQAADLTPDMHAPEGYFGAFHCAEKKGYSGVGIYSRCQPDAIVEGINHAGFDAEGRCIRADFADLSVVSVYIPSGSSSEQRQDSKYEFLDYFYPYLQNLLQTRRKVVVCGDWNTVHRELDIKNWKGNQKNSGCLPEERAWLDKIYANGWVDVYRNLYPTASGEGYTWWSNRGRAYANNVGWRIDLQVANANMAQCAKSSSVYKEQKFSDHAPLTVDYLLESA